MITVYDYGFTITVYDNGLRLWFMIKISVYGYCLLGLCVHCRWDVVAHWCSTPALAAT